LRVSRRHGAQLVKAGKGRWSAGAEAEFLAQLRASGCLRRAARAVGFSTTAIHKRLNAYPSFAQSCQAAIRQARMDLESMVLSAGIATFDPEGIDDGEEAARPKVSVAEAIAFLRLNPSAKGVPAPSRDWSADEQDIEEVRAEVLRKVAAMERAGRARPAVEAPPGEEAP